jgi:hypothetical protein
MKGRVVGIVILVVIVAAALIYQFVLRNGDRDGGILNRELIQISGIVGSVKARFLDNPDVKDILRSRYGLEIDYQTVGSLEMTGMDSAGVDFIWPSSQVALELYIIRRGATGRRETIFNSPIVFYTWMEVATALVANGYARVAADGHFEAPLGPLVSAVLDGAQWSDLGLGGLYGSAAIVSTNPSRSSSGNLFAGLVASVLNGGVVSEAALPEVLPALLRLFELQGYMEHSTEQLFGQYLELGVGSFPLVVGYENQMIELALGDPATWAGVQDQVAVVYPVPTMFSEHPVLALTENGERIIEALLDEDVQAIAWERHGFRTGLDNDPSELGMRGMPAGVTQVVRVPVPEVMDEITRALEQGTPTPEEPEPPPPAVRARVKNN